MKPAKHVLVPVMFRLSAEHIAMLDRIAADLARKDRTPKTRTDAIREVINAYATREGK